MEVQKLQSHWDKLLPLLANVSQPRYGLHVSDLIESIQRQLNMVEARDSDSDPRLYFAVGLAWEHYVLSKLQTLHPNRYIMGLQLECDGIVCTLDAWDMENNEVVECKATWKAVREVTERWAWMAQIKAYCWVIGTTTAVIYPLHVNGSWRPPVPQSEPVRITFTSEELAENWNMLINYRDTLREPRLEGNK